MANVFIESSNSFSATFHPCSAAPAGDARYRLEKFSAKIVRLLSVSLLKFIAEDLSVRKLG